MWALAAGNPNGDSDADDGRCFFSSSFLRRALNTPTYEDVISRDE